jgi:exopolysaccharide/PEP-CTERM locus tyrosine autokinase
MGKMFKALQKAKAQEKAKQRAQNYEPAGSSLQRKDQPVLQEKCETNQSPREKKANFSEIKNQKNEQNRILIDSNQTVINDHLDCNRFYNEYRKMKFPPRTGNENKLQDDLNCSRKACSEHLSEKEKFVVHSSKTRRQKTLFTLYNPTSVISEHFKVIRTILLNMTSTNKVKTLLVTSLYPHEGKSFFSSNLAVSIAHSIDKYVLLIDADLKKPSLPKYFAIKPDIGLTDFFLDQTRQLSFLIQKTEIPKLSILASGSACRSSSELVSSDSMSHLIHELKHRYIDRYVIFDSAPVQMSDTLSLANKVDGIIIVVKAGKTSKKLVKQAIQKLGKEKILGIVLNFCKVDLKKNYAYSQYKLSTMQEKIRGY